MPYRYVPHQRVGFLRRFGLDTGINFAHFGLESGMVFEGNTGVYERTYCFNSKLMSKKEKEICDFDTSSETQGQMVWARESLNGREKMVRRKVKNGEKGSFLFFCPWVSEDDFDMDFKKYFLLLF